MAWAFSAEKPIYTQIKEVICTMIATGRYSPGQKFPAVREIASEAGVNPNTMQKALSELETEGYLSTSRTAGRMVTGDTGRIDALRAELAAEAADNYLTRMETIDYSTEGAIIFIQNYIPKR